MRDFYELFYTLAVRSPAYATFCERVFGQNLDQHGFADMTQLTALMNVLQLQPGHKVLDLGCGSGQIAEYIADCTGAQVTGLDYIPQAITLAQERTASKADQLRFIVGDINALTLPDSTFDVVISIDSMYFSEDYARTIRQLIQAMRPNGQMAFFYGYGREPWVPKAEFPTDSIQPNRTPLALALQANGLRFETQDFSQDDYRLARRRLEVLPELRAGFEADGILAVYDNRIGDAQGMKQAYAEGLAARYLYHVQL